VGRGACRASLVGFEAGALAIVSGRPPPVRLLETTHRVLDAAVERIGRAVMWLALVLVILEFLIVGLRYAFFTTFIMMQEAVIYVHATLFMIGASYALLHDAHVRVDIFYGSTGSRTRAWIELTAVLVAVIPFCAVVLWSSWAFVSQAWAVREGSMFVGGIPAVYLLKTLIPVFAMLLLVVGASVLVRAVLVLRGRRADVFDERFGDGGG